MISFLCYVAAALFLGLLVFSVSLAGVPLLAAGLFCIALGLLFGSAPVNIP